MSRTSTRIKICGITRVEDALAAADAGADAIGLVFYAKSPRHVAIERAAEICAALPPFVSTVGLFVDADPDFIGEVLTRVPLDLLQFHGDESAAECERHGRPHIKALRMRPGIDLCEVVAGYGSARGVLLDTYRPGVPGGTGEAFDWTQVPSDLKTPIILAGGLSPDNVGEAVRRVRPWAVDVSGGVESAPGVKDSGRIADFVEAVRAADRSERIE
ncbi:MAG: phosphoribosylanthranilate isomerase [Gammaproteobacteria bacterium]|nr:phosphoribosylanthranilate isomerase [Gammaproteobacteria bacterium]